MGGKKIGAARTEPVAAPGATSTSVTAPAWSPTTMADQGGDAAAPGTDGAAFAEGLNDNGVTFCVVCASNQVRAWGNEEWGG